MSKKRKKFEPIRTICRVIHQPSYCFLQAIDPISDKPPYYERKRLSAFKTKNDLQSKHSQKRLQNAINWMLLFANEKRVYSKKPFINKKGIEQHNFKFRLAFITLTLSSAQAHTDYYIKEHMLQPFLYWLHRYYQATYTWKAEAQINGNIHFHITTDVFVHWRSIRAKWNSLQAAHNYKKVYQDGSHDENPNSTDVHCVKNEKDVAKYLAAYCSKKSSITAKDWEKIKRLNITPQFVWCLWDEKLKPEAQDKTWYKRTIAGRLWGCSEALSNIRCFTDELENHYNLATVEKQFFHDNNLRRLSTILINEEKQKLGNITPEQELELNKKYYSFSKVFIHRNLRFCKLPEVIQTKLTTEREQRKFTKQTFFTTESLT